MSTTNPHRKHQINN